MVPTVACKEVEGQAKGIIHEPESQEQVAIEFAGWMPVFNRFGHCGGHPQFNTVQKPPSGYVFIREQPVFTPFADPPQLLGKAQLFWMWCRSLPAMMLRYLWLCLCLPFRLTLTIIETGVTYGPIRCLRTLGGAMRLLLILRRGGCRLIPSLHFVHNRHFTSQVMLPRDPKLLFLTSVPYTYSQHPWVIEIEDPMSLFFPYVNNGETAALRLEDSPYLPIVRSLLEDKRCRGILTHIRSTADALPRMFQSEGIGRKVAYVPMGVEPPAEWQTQEDDDTVELFFSCSWHQNPQSLFLRGGLDVLAAFEILHERYPHLRLTMRTSLPNLEIRYRKIMDQPRVRVFDRFLPDKEMKKLMRSMHIFLLPAARIHIVSVLKAMSYGQVAVVSDGWGFEEYVDHQRNGLIVPGRWGKVSWTDPSTGMLRENYRPMYQSDDDVVEGLVAAVSTLVEDRNLRRRLSAQARQDVEDRFNLENWNDGLKQFLDRALANGC